MYLTSSSVLQGASDKKDQRSRKRNPAILQPAGELGEQAGMHLFCTYDRKEIVDRWDRQSVLLPSSMQWRMQVKKKYSI